MNVVALFLLFGVMLDPISMTALMVALIVGLVVYDHLQADRRPHA
jgi:hypothetical protein